MEACGSPFFCFVLDVRRFPGYFSSGVVVCPGFVAFSWIFPSAVMVCPGFGIEMRMFCWCRGCLSRKQCVFRDKVQ